MSLQKMLRAGKGILLGIASVLFVTGSTPVVLAFGFGDNSSFSGFDQSALNEVLSGEGSDGGGGGVLKQVEDRYNINRSTLENYAEYMNVSDEKGNAPEVKLVFTPTDPKRGEEASVHAFSMFFSNPLEQLYYTWYLKRRDCDVDNTPNAETKKRCDMDDDGRIEVEDWKIAAARIIAQGGYDPTLTTPVSTGGDDDGYRARFGGDGQVPGYGGGRNYCYLHDFKLGKDYEVNTITLDKDGNKVVKDLCAHFFARADDTGDGSFTSTEEDFWGTNPHDPDTAQNGNKDEANVVGLGRQEFKWVYDTGDQVGVIVEGLSLNPTKHDNASKMVMWAFPKNDCKPARPAAPSPGAATSDNTTCNANYLGCYTQTVRTRAVVFETATFTKKFRDECVEKNLVDPTEGGQAGSLSFKLSTQPASPVVEIVTDTTISPQGDALSVQAVPQESVNNPSAMWYSWDVKASTTGKFDPRFDDPTQWTSLTSDSASPNLVKDGNISQIVGNGLNEIRLNLNLKNEYAKYFNTDGVAYLYFSVVAKDNFQAGVGQGGRSGMVVQVTLRNRQIQAYQVDITDATPAKVSLSTSEFCSTGPDQSVCRIAKNQIVGVKVPTDIASKYDSFSWLINGKPLLCTEDISSKCSNKSQGAVNFFPALGEPGEQYAVSVAMTKSATGDSVTMTKTFEIVQPGVSVATTDESGAVRKYLGQYLDVDGNITKDYSQSIFQAASGSTVIMKPEYLTESIKDFTQLAWVVDGETQVPEADGTISFSISDLASKTYTVELKGIYRQPQKVRKALRDIWGVSQLDSTESYLSAYSQIEVIPNEESVQGPFSGPRKYFAAIITYVPETVLFTLRVAFTLALALFSVGFIKSFLPQSYERR